MTLLKLHSGRVQVLRLGYQPSHGSSGAWDVEEELSGKALLPASVSLPEALPSPVH